MITMGNLNENGAKFFGMGASSGSSGGVLVVTLTNDDNGNIVADKTFDEISAAIEAGMAVTVKDGCGNPVLGANLCQYMAGMMVSFNLVQLTPSDYTKPTVMDQMIYTAYVCQANNTWISQDTVVPFKTLLT